MIPELGNFALVLALCLAVAQAFFALTGAAIGNRQFMAVARPAVAGQFVFAALAFGCLTWSFLQSDFTVKYVAMNSNTLLPTMYKVSAVWGAHEGSLLLWILVLAFWSLAVAAFSRSLPERFATRVLGIMGLISIGFLVFTLATSNPFERLLQFVAEGRDLNPLLQDPALAIHPPMLYTGYVGFSVAFAFAVAAMLEGKLDAAWARWTRPWTLAAWLFLTVGIALGSWWAYYELGWGGWWFWDPVENASFMPWLVGTALIHSLAVTEKRGIFQSWTLLLAIAAFSLSLLGTFLVRSGILVSVHAFATDPTRGAFILAFLAIVILGALVLYAIRAPQLVSKQGFALLSRETFLLLNNALLVVSAAAVLYGTLSPLFYDALGLGKISVGPPWFNLVFGAIMLPLVFLIGVGMHVAWRTGNAAALRRRLTIPAVFALVAGLVITFSGYRGGSAMTAVGVVAALWIVASSLVMPVMHVREGRRISTLPLSVFGMVIAHMGLGVFVLGVTVTSSYSIQSDAAMRPGDVQSVAGYDFELMGVAPTTGPNYEAQEGTVQVTFGGEHVAVLRPQKRVYTVQRNPMTESDIDSGLIKDLYVALGDELGDGAWSVRVQYKPLVRLIWLGCLIMAIGGLLAMGDRRYRRARSRAEATADGTALAGSQG
ncbi:MAG: heme lyase CcmF/NrfE family subunit [Pseudomonadota bacterium]